MHGAQLSYNCIVKTCTKAETKMDGDWSEVKAPKKKPKPQPQMQQASGPTGGKKGKNVLVAGAVKPQGRYGGPGAYSSAQASAAQEYNNHASAVADYDFGDDAMDEEIKYELVSHKCAQSVKNARMGADKTQAQLAKMVNEKTTTIVEVENATARYSADLINRIERALNVKIDRGRKKRR